MNHHLVSDMMFQKWPHLVSDSMSYRHGTDPTRLCDEDVAVCALPVSHLFLQQKAWDPRRLSTSRLAGNHNHPGGAHG